MSPVDIESANSPDAKLKPNGLKNASDARMLSLFDQCEGDDATFEQTRHKESFPKQKAGSSSNSIDYEL